MMESTLKNVYGTWKLAFFTFRKTIFVIHGNDLSLRPVIIFEKYSPEGQSVLKYH